MSDVSQQMTAVECQNNVLLTYEQSPRKKPIFGHSSLNPHGSFKQNALLENGTLVCALVEACREHINSDKSMRAHGGPYAVLSLLGLSGGMLSELFSIFESLSNLSYLCYSKIQRWKKIRTICPPT